jgi:hypothetical protein
MELHADYLNPETHDEQGIPNLVTSSLQNDPSVRCVEVVVFVSASGAGEVGSDD